MSASGYLVSLSFNSLGQDVIGRSEGLWEWRLSHAINGIGGGSFQMLLGDATESELLSLAQQKTVIEVNNATNNAEQFVLADIRGGGL